MWTARRLASDENTYGNLKGSSSGSSLPPLKGAAGERRKALTPMSKNTTASQPLKPRQAPMSGGDKAVKGEPSAKPRRALGEITNRVKSSKSSSSSSSSSSGLGVELWKPTEAPRPPQQPHLPVMAKKQSASVEGLRSAVEAMRLVEEEDDVESVELAAGRLGDEEDALIDARDEEDSVGDVAVWEEEDERRDLLEEEELLKVKDEDDSELWEGLEEFLGEDEEEQLWKDDDEDLGGVICDVAISEEEEEQGGKA